MEPVGALGDAWSSCRGDIIGQLLDFISPHPGLLPEGEGIASINKSPGFMSSMASIKLGLTESGAYRELRLC